MTLGVHYGCIWIKSAFVCQMQYLMIVLKGSVPIAFGGTKQPMENWYPLAASART